MANFLECLELKVSGLIKVEKWSEYTKRVCEHRYGRAPRVTINGHLNAHFAYLEQPLGYILSELIKNAMRATLENHMHDSHVPDVAVTIGKEGMEVISGPWPSYSLFLVACYATLHPALSVGRSVCWSHFTFFMIFIFGPHCSCSNGLVTSNMVLPTRTRLR